MKAADYSVNKYAHYEPEILKEFEAAKGTRLERAIESIALEKCGFYLLNFA